MRISETVRKLDPRQIILSYQTKAHADDVIATIDPESFFALRKNARAGSKTLNALKYFNLQAYIGEHVQRALDLRLNGTRKKILDIGTGFGYFPYICEYFGNQALSIDVPGHQLFDDVTDYLGVKKIHQPIEPFKPVAGLSRSFDLVTAFQVSFDRYDYSTPWREKEWSFFLEDLFTNVLKPGGLLAMEMNYDLTERSWVNSGARQAMQRYDTWIFGANVRVRSRS